jgi:hypothetical protein
MSDLPAAPFDACDQAKGADQLPGPGPLQDEHYSVPVAYGSLKVWITGALSQNLSR